MNRMKLFISTLIREGNLCLWNKVLVYLASFIFILFCISVYFSFRNRFDLDKETIIIFPSMLPQNTTFFGESPIFWNSTENESSLSKELATIFNEMEPDFNKPKIAVIMHVGVIGEVWYERTMDVIDALIQSELIYYADQAVISYVGQLPDKDQLSDTWNLFQIIQASKYVEDYEFPTLEFVHIFAKSHPDYYILYVHNKGATHKGAQSIIDWINLMIYFNIIRWKESIKFLTTHDIVCVNILLKPYIHCSGNFWWARADHIVNLPIPSIYYPNDFQSKTHYAEFWIGTVFWPLNSISEYEKHFCNLHPNAIDHYFYLYPPSNYVNRPFKCFRGNEWKQEN